MTVRTAIRDAVQTFTRLEEDLGVNCAVYQTTPCALGVENSAIGTTRRFATQKGF